MVRAFVHHPRKNIVLDKLEPHDIQLMKKEGGRLTSVINPESFTNQLQKHRLVAAIKDPKNLEKAVKYKDNIGAVILMTGTILTAKKFVDYLQSNGLPVLLHVERIGGLQMDHDGVEFIKRYMKPAGIVTTKSGIVKRAKEKGLFVIQRVFLIDTDMYLNLEKGLTHNASDMFEVMPSRVPEYISRLTGVSDKPIITGGLLSSLTHAKSAFDHGATAVSTSNTEIWKTNMNNLL